MHRTVALAQRRRWPSLTALVGELYLRFAGWTTEGELPASSKAVFIAAPHTSNWDMPHMLAVSWVYGIRLHWLGKHTLFRGWRGPLMRRLGGIAVDRRAPNGVVGTLVERFAASDGLYLAIAPAGTRAKGNHWRSGFYHIARAARVPVVCGFLDYDRKVGGVGPSFLLTGDVRSDMNRIRTFYRGISGRRERGTADIRLSEEAATSPAEAAYGCSSRAVPGSP